jgi:hypothetical protein
MSGTPSLPDGSTYRCSSLTSLHLQAKGSEYSFTTRRRVAERNSPNKRRAVRVRNSSSGPCVPNPSIEPKPKLFAQAFHAAAKVIHRGLRGAKTGRSSPSVNNFGWTISAPVLWRFRVRRADRHLQSHPGESALLTCRCCSASIPTCLVRPKNNPPSPTQR